MHRTGTKHVVRHLQKSVIQWSVISKFTCICSWYTDLKSAGQNSYLFHLELDGGPDLGDLGWHVVGVGQHRWKLAGLVESGTKQTRNLSDEGVGCKEGIILLG